MNTNHFLPAQLSFYLFKYLPLFHENEHFQSLSDLVYTLCMVPPEEVVHAFESVVEPYLEDHLADSENNEQV